MTTNYERLKNMTVQEMAEFIQDIIPCGACPIFENCPDIAISEELCTKKLTKWLKSESEE